MPKAVRTHLSMLPSGLGNRGIPDEAKVQMTFASFSGSTRFTYIIFSPLESPDVGTRNPSGSAGLERFFVIEDAGDDHFQRIRPVVVAHRKTV